MIGVKEIHKILLGFFESHMQINGVYAYDVKGFISDPEKAYTAANIQYYDSNVNGKVQTFNFQITLADLLTPSKDNELDIYDSTLAIAEDFLTFLQYHNSFNFTNNAFMTNFSDSDGDRIAGVTFRISLQVIRRQNLCVVPILS